MRGLASLALSANPCAFIIIDFLVISELTTTTRHTYVLYHETIPPMDDNGVAQIVGALEVIHRSSSSNDQRRSAQIVSVIILRKC